jgi:branched-subunit amino acid transport protein
VSLAPAVLWLLIGLLALVTLVARNLFLVLPPRWQPRGAVEQALRVAPLAALLAITVPEIVRDLPARAAAAPGWAEATLAAATDPRLSGALALLLVVRITRKSLWGLAAGGAVYLALLARAA